MGNGVQSAGARVAACAAIGLAYFGAAKLGLELAFATPSVTAIWPPAGIALAALVLGGPRLWPGVALGAFLANVTTDVPLYTTLGITVGNTLEALVGVWLLRRVGFDPRLPRITDIVSLTVLAGFLSTTVAATIGVASLTAGDEIMTSTASVWRIWWLGDAGGVLLVAPFLMTLVTHWPFRSLPGRAVEAVGMVALVVGVSLLVFSRDVGMTFMFFPVLIWAALRFWQPGATAAALTAGIIAVAFTASGEGPFIEASEDDSLLLAQLFAGVAGLTGLVLAVLSRQRVEVERETADIASTLQAALLPPRLPSVPRLETAAWHRPGQNLQDIGGDFYDLFQTGEAEWDGVIGDVCGKGPEAASLTGLARHTLRAVAADAPAPSAVLSRLNRAVLEQGDSPSFLTASYARVHENGDSMRVTIANAGHPSPLVVRANGDVEEAGGAGMLLGVSESPPLSDAEIELREGDAVVLYTDGLVDMDEEGDGFGWLREVLRTCGGDHAQEIADRVRREAVPRAKRLDDDQALMVLRST